MVVEDALVSNSADNNDVLELTVPSSGQGGSKLDEHPTPVMLGREDQHGVSTASRHFTASLSETAGSDP